MNATPSSQLALEIDRNYSIGDWPCLLRLAMAFGTSSSAALDKAIGIVESKSFGELGQQYWLLEQLRRFQAAASDPKNQIDVLVEGSWSFVEETTLRILRSFPLAELCSSSEFRLEEEKDELFSRGSAAAKHCSDASLEIEDFGLAAYFRGLHGRSLMMRNKMKEAEESLESARQLFCDAENSKPRLYVAHFAKVLGTLSAVQLQLSKYEDAITNCSRSIDLFRSLTQIEPGHELDFAISLSTIGSIYYSVHDFERSNKFHKLALKIAGRPESADTRIHAGVLHNAGVGLAAVCDFGSAYRAFRRALKILESSKTVDTRADQADTLNNMGICDFHLSRYERANQNFNVALALRKELAKIRPNVHLPRVTLVLTNLSATYRALQNPDDSLKAASDAAALCESLIENDLQIEKDVVASTLLNYGSQLLNKGHTELAIQTYDGAVKIYHELNQVFEGSFNEHIAIGFAGLAKSLSLSGDSDLSMHAEHGFQAALGLYDQLASKANYHRPGYGTVLQLYSEWLFQQGREFEALVAINNAARQFSDFDHEGYRGDLLSRLRVYANAGRMLYHHYKHDNDPEKLWGAFQWLMLAQNDGESLRSGFSEERLRFTVQSALKIVNESFFVACIELYYLQGNPAYLKKAFEVAERDRARSLCEMLADESPNLSHIPKQLAEDFVKLRQAYIHKSRLLDRSELLYVGGCDSQGAELNSINREAVRYRINQLKIQRDLANEAYRKCVQQIKEIDPDFRAEQDFESVSVGQLQNQLPPHVAAIQLIFSGESAFAIVVSNSDISSVVVKHLQLSELEQRVSKWVDQDYQGDGQSEPELRREGSARLAPILKAVGKTLVDAVLQGIPDGVSQIVVCPSRSLQSVPLHACFTSDGTLLGEKYAISIVASFSILLKQLNRVHSSETKLLVVHSDDPTLQFSKAEVASVSSTLGSDPTLLSRGEDFREHARESGILYFSGHAAFEFTSPLDSLLQTGMSGETTSLRDVYMRFRVPNMQLVVLNSCRSGMQLPNPLDDVETFPCAFLYAGARCVVSSLWKVDDLAALLFTKRFCDNLQRGSSISAAVQLAQRWLSGRPDDQGKSLATQPDVLRYADQVNLFGFAETQKRKAGYLRTIEWHMEDYELPFEKPFSDPLYWAPYYTFGIGWDPIKR